MSKDVATTGTQLTVTQRAIVALGFDEKKEIELRELAARTTTIAAITNKDGYTQVHNGRMALKNQRVEIQNAGKVARDDATKFSKAVIAEEKRLIAVILPEEDRLEKIQDAYDAAAEAEKQARIDAELKRVTDLQERVAYLRGSPNISSMSPPELIAEHIIDLESEVVDASMQEYEQQAREAKAAGLSRLRDMHAAAVARVAEQERIKAERAELEALRAAQAKRDAEERARIAEEEKAAKAARDQELVEQRLEQARIDAELKAKRDADAAELKAQREAQEKEAAAERRRLADERAAFEKEQADARRVAEEAERVKREQAALSEANKPKPKNVKAAKPTDLDMVQVLATHYRVHESKIVEWILEMDLSNPELFAA